MIGHLYTLLFNSGSAAPSVVPAGKSLAEHEAEWALKRAAEAIEKAKGPQERRRAKRAAAKEVYFSKAVEHANALIAAKETAEVAEIQALIDLQTVVDPLHVEVARTAAKMARKRREAAQAAIEEFDILYVAAMLAEV